MKDQKRLTLDELLKDRLDQGLSNYSEGAGTASISPADCGANTCSDCLPCENYCHDA